MSMHVTTSPLETEDLGYKLATAYRYDTYPVVLLDGDLASGKTTFTKGIARALGIKKLLNSPSYTIMKTYQSEDLTKTLHHLDLYRLNQLGIDFDLEEYVYGKHFTVIEWPFQIKEIMPLNYILVTFKTVDETIREIDISCHGHLCKEEEVSL